MCDTIVALKNSTSTNSVLLAKSADTEVNEAEQIVKYPRKEYSEGTAARITHRKIPQTKITYEVILGRSFWAWGSELGASELGVSVGNEAAFSNQVNKDDGVCCLDLCRIAAERSLNAKDAAEILGQLVEEFGQGGNTQMMGNFAFDSGLLVADTSEAYVINCAGKHWAAKKVKDVYAMSNRYQITDDWDLSSFDKESFPKKNFNQLFEDKNKPDSVCASVRENRAQKILEEKKGNISLQDMADIMRDLGEDGDNYDPEKAELKQNFVCMHAKPHPDAFWGATGAMITDSNEEGIIVWMTGTSANDLSIFKPLFFGIPLPNQLNHQPRGTYDSKSLWWKHEFIHRKAIMNYKTLKPEIRGRFDEVEKSFFNQSSSLRTAPKKEKIEFSKYCWDESEKITDLIIKDISKINFTVKNGPFKDMWDTFNKEANFQI
jgi:secernin